MDIFKSVYRTSLLTYSLWKKGELISYQLSIVVADGNTEDRPDHDRDVRIESGFEYELVYTVHGVEKVYYSTAKNDVERLITLLNDVNSKLYKD